MNRECGNVSRMAGFVFCLLLLAVGCVSEKSTEDNQSGGASAALTGRLIVTGSSTVAPVLSEIAKRFESRHSDVRIDVQAGGSGKGIADARSGQSDIGMASRPLKSDEQDLTAYRIADDGVCLIVHQANLIKELTRQQVVAVYTDQVNNWKELGGSDQPIHVIHKAEGRATLEVFLKYFDLRNPDVLPDVIAGHNEQAIQSVAGSPGAIGYVSIGAAEADVQEGIAIRLLPLSGIPATSESVGSGMFPMSRPLNIVTRSSPSRLATAFINFARSQDVHDIIRDQYFIPASR